MTNIVAETYHIEGVDTQIGSHLRELLEGDASMLKGTEEDASMLKGDSSLRERCAGTLFYCAGTESDADAEYINVEKLRDFLNSGKADAFSRLVYVSSWRVYSPDAGRGVDETRPTFAWSEAGRTRALAERECEKWAAPHAVTLTIVRPAWIFGRGMEGEMAHLFARVVRGHYVHIRGNDACMSAITAVDAARCIALLAGTPGIFNLSDGREHRWIDIVEAMTANAGARRRMSYLPPKWAEFFYRWFGAVPMVREMLSPEALEPLQRNLTLSNTRAAEATGMTFFDTEKVIAREEPDFPYADR